MKEHYGKLHKRGQYALEYALIIAVSVVALISIQAYLKRGIQGKIKESADTLGEEYSYNNTLARRVSETYRNSKGELFVMERYILEDGSSATSETTVIGDLKNE